MAFSKQLDASLWPEWVINHPKHPSLPSQKPYILDFISVNYIREIRIQTFRRCQQPSGKTRLRQQAESDVSRSTYSHYQSITIMRLPAPWINSKSSARPAPTYDNHVSSPKPALRENSGKLYIDKPSSECSEGKSCILTIRYIVKLSRCVTKYHL